MSRILLGDATPKALQAPIMTKTNLTDQLSGLSLRQAALIAGFGLLVMVFCGPFVEFYVYPKYLFFDDMAKTVSNIQQNPTLFLSGVMAHFIVFVMDVIVAWALYVLFRPVNPAFSLLTAWFRVVYATISFVAVFYLFAVVRIATSPDAAALYDNQFHAQIYTLLSLYRYIWYAALVIFGIYLLCLSGLILGSSYVPRILSIPVAIAGLGWIIDSLAPYFAPDLDLGWVFYTFFGELIFMLWLLTGGWFLKTPDR